MVLQGQHRFPGAIIGRESTFERGELTAPIRLYRHPVLFEQCGRLWQPEPVGAVGIERRTVEDQTLDRIRMCDGVIQRVRATRGMPEDTPSVDPQLPADRLEIVDQQWDCERWLVRCLIGAEHTALVDAHDSDPASDESIRDRRHEVPARVAGTAVGEKQGVLAIPSAVIDEDPGPVDREGRFHADDPIHDVADTTVCLYTSMLLNVIESGSGDRSVLLLHGMSGSAESWWRVSQRLVDDGHHVLAMDLPGHGHSPRDPTSTVASAADAVVETVAALAPDRPIVAMGHSYGGTVLAAAADRLLLGTAVYVDTTGAFTGGADRDALIAQYASDRRSRQNATWLRETRPFYSEMDAFVEARAADRFDPVTAASISSGADVEHLPAPGSILLRADPSRFVTDADAERFAAQGIDVRTIPGAAHTVWFSHFDEFVAALPEVFGVDAPVGR